MLSEIMDEVRIHLADSQCSKSKFFENSDLTLYINNALLSLFPMMPNDALLNYEKLDEQNLISGREYYDLPSDYFIEMSVMYNNVACRKIKYSDQGMVSNNYFAQPLASQPGYTINDNDIYLFPSPPHDSALGLKFYYLAKPPVLENATDEVYIDMAYKQIIAQLASGRAVSLKESVEEGKILIQSAINDLKVITNKDVVEEQK